MLRPIALTMLAAAALATGGCRKPAPVPEPTPSATVSATPASILREAPEPVVAEPPTGPFTLTIPFGDAGDALPDGVEAAIASVLASDQFGDGGTIILRGHSDSVGSDDVNLEASRRRAETIARALRDAGVDADRITVIPLGEMRPVAPNARLDGTPDEEGRSKNRRVDVEVLLPPESAEPVTAGEAAPSSDLNEIPEKK